MQNSQFTDAQIVAILQQAERGEKPIQALPISCRRRVSTGPSHPPGMSGSLGVILVVAFTQQYPFTGASHHEVAQAIMTQKPRLAAPLPAPFDAIVRGCLIKDRKARWTARQVLDALTSRPASVPAPPPSPVVSPPRTTRPQTSGMGTQPTISATPAKRTSIPAGFWGLGGLLLGGLVVANMVSGHTSTPTPTTATPPSAYHSSPPTGHTKVQQKGPAGKMSVALAKAPTRHETRPRHAVAYHRTFRSSVGDLHSQSSVGNSSGHGNSNMASSDTSDSLH